MMPVPITYVVSDKVSDPINSLASLMKDMLNSICDGKGEECIDIIEDRMNIQMFCPIPNLANNGGRITLRNNPSSLKVLHHADDTCPSSTKLCFWDRRLKQVRTPRSQKLGIRTMNDKACSIDAIPRIPPKLTFTNLDGGGSQEMKIALQLIASAVQES